MASIKKLALNTLEVAMSPFTLAAALWFKYIRTNLIGFSVNKSIISEKILLKVGVFPIIDHYYEPLFNFHGLKSSLRLDRKLFGINLNVPFQLSLLSQFNFRDELLKFKEQEFNELAFNFANPAYQSGDAEYLYNIIRHYKPRKLIEIGSGNSTLMAQHAISNNHKHNSDYSCEHICIEPYHHSWLEKANVKVVRKLLEEVDLQLFAELGENDILFIDSSHIIRPQGDVLLEYLTILPTLAKGVIVHIHDIFTPKDYLDQWLKVGKVFWNEQYLLEAFLTNNDSFEIIGALNYLKHNHYNEMNLVCPFLTPEREPGAFWIKKSK